MKKKILIMAGYYLPSLKGGGPIRSIRNLVDNLGDQADFYILASDRDLGDEEPFENVVLNKWTKVEKAQVYYTDNNLLNKKTLKAIVQDINFDVLYLNSFFSLKYSILPLLINKYTKSFTMKVILAPRGQFSKGAMGIGKLKKRIFITISKRLNLYKNVKWHATNDLEKKDIEKVFGTDSEIYVANNLPSDYSNLKYNKALKKEEGRLKLIYISQIHPMKNLIQVLEILREIDGNVEFNIYGPIEDKDYWIRCENLIKNMRNNIKVNYFGEISNENVQEAFINHHVAILLTLGENYGHVISEAMIGGCPVIISDRTPWRNLSMKKVGYDISLNCNEKFIHIIKQYIEMNDKEYRKVSRKSFYYAKVSTNLDENINSYLKMFDIFK